MRGSIEYRALCVIHAGWKPSPDPLIASPPCEQNGTLKIIDRKKHIFKLAQGEYIAPEKIENIYLRSEPVAQVFVHGESLQVCAFLTVNPTAQALLAPSPPGAQND